MNDVVNKPATNSQQVSANTNVSSQTKQNNTTDKGVAAKATSSFDESVAKKTSELSSAIETKILNALEGKKDQNGNVVAKQFDVLLYLDSRTLFQSNYQDYQLIGLLSTIVIVTFLRLLNIYPIVPISSIIGYYIYILIILVKEKLWDLMVQ